jgi:hypothetical protein
MSSCCEQGDASRKTRTGAQGDQALKEGTGAFENSVEGNVIFQGYAIDFIHGRARVS